MIRITSVSLPIGFTDKTVRKAVCRKLRIDDSQISGASHINISFPKTDEN